MQTSFLSDRKVQKYQLKSNVVYHIRDETTFNEAKLNQATNIYYEAPEETFELHMKQLNQIEYLHYYAHTMTYLPSTLIYLDNWNGGIFNTCIPENVRCIRVHGLKINENMKFPSSLEKLSFTFYTHTCLNEAVDISTFTQNEYVKGDVVLKRHPMKSNYLIM